MYAMTLVFLFIIRLRFPKSRTLIESLQRRYDRSGVQIYRRLERILFRSKKLEEDLKFLNICKQYQIVPKFIKFKTYSQSFQFTHMYRSWQFKLLDLEINSQKRKFHNLSCTINATRVEFRNAFSFIDLKYLESLLESSIEKKLVDVKVTHSRKLKNLGIDLSKSIDTNKVMFNLSSRVLTVDEKDVLGLGLDFALPPAKVSFMKHFLDFERLCNVLKSCALYGHDTQTTVFRKIATIANDTYRRACRECKDLKEDRVLQNKLRVLGELRDDSNIVITKPDKGKGVVVMNQSDYDGKMLEILSDTTKFKLLNVDLATHLLKLEDKLNRILRTIKTKIGDFVYSELYASGSRPGYMYGLPKVHKPGNPLRPIISSIGTFNYNLAKFLVGILKPLTKNEYTIINSASFIRDFFSHQFDNNVVMASFDVVSLFTNIPLKETTDIILNNVDNDHLKTFGLEKPHLSKLLNLATCESIFTFKDGVYNQIDGVGMGSCLGPTYADCFLGYFEQQWLRDCPLVFKPLYYRRYVDDTFLIFKRPSHVELFLDYLNSKHRNIKFTSEVEIEGKISFLDILVTKGREGFSTSVYRKNTYTGLGLNYLSFSAYLFKINSIRTLINRAYNVCSSYIEFDLEMGFLKEYFLQNSYPGYLFHKILKSFLDNKFSSEIQKLTVNKDCKYVRLPYVGKASIEIKRKLNNILRSTYPQIKFQFVFTNSFTVGSFFKSTSTLPSDLRSCVVYLFTCPQCGLRYVGSTSRWLKQRTQDHRGVSFRTGLPLTSPPFSAIREHSLAEDHPYTNLDFRVLTQASSRSDLLISESLFINRMRPELNNSLSAFQLFTR